LPISSARWASVTAGLFGIVITHYNFSLSALLPGHPR
jgi:hypothetical protein